MWEESVGRRFAWSYSASDFRRENDESFRRHFEGHPCRDSSVLNAKSIRDRPNDGRGLTETGCFACRIDQFGSGGESARMTGENRFLFDLFENVAKADRRPREGHSKTTEPLAELNCLLMVSLLILEECRSRRVSSRPSVISNGRKKHARRAATIWKGQVGISREKKCSCCCCLFPLGSTWQFDSVGSIYLQILFEIRLGAVGQIALLKDLLDLKSIE